MLGVCCLFIRGICRNPEVILKLSKMKCIVIVNIPLSTGGYNTTPTTPQGYSQPVQGYGGSSYDASSTSSSTNQSSYGGQAAYSAQPAYTGYGQQTTASSAPPRYYNFLGSCSTLHYLCFSLERRYSVLCFYFK